MSGVIEAAELSLRERAGSFFKDSQKLAKVPGESLTAACYRQIADELRSTADMLRDMRQKDQA